MEVARNQLWDFSNHSHGSRSGPDACVFGRCGLQRGRIVTCALHRSRRISTPREFRTTGWKGRRGRIMCELKARAEEIVIATAIQVPSKRNLTSADLPAFRLNGRSPPGRDHDRFWAASPKSVFGLPGDCIQGPSNRHIAQQQYLCPAWPAPDHPRAKQLATSPLRAGCGRPTSSFLSWPGRPVYAPGRSP